MEEENIKFVGLKSLRSFLDKILDLLLGKADVANTYSKEEIDYKTSVDDKTIIRQDAKLGVNSKDIPISSKVDYVTKYVYVNVLIGDDLKGDGTQTKPYRTVQKAVDDFDRLIGYGYVEIMAAGIYSQFAIKNINGHLLTIRKNKNVIGDVIIDGNCMVYHSKSIRFEGLSFIEKGSKNANVLNVYSSNVSVKSCSFSFDNTSHYYAGIYCRYCSYLSVLDGNTFTNCINGIFLEEFCTILIASGSSLNGTCVSNGILSQGLSTINDVSISTFINLVCGGNKLSGIFAKGINTTI